MLSDVDEKHHMFQFLGTAPAGGSIGRHVEACKRGPGSVVLKRRAMLGLNE